MRYSVIFTALSLTSAVLSAPLPAAKAVVKRDDGSSIFVPVDINCIGKDLGDILRKRAAEDGNLIYAPITCEESESSDSTSTSSTGSTGTTSTTTKRADGSSIFVPVDINCIGKDLGDILKKRNPEDGSLLYAPITCEESESSDSSSNSGSSTGSTGTTSSTTKKRDDVSSVFVPVDINCIGKDLGDILKKRAAANSDGSLLYAPITCEESESSEGTGATKL